MAVIAVIAVIDLPVFCRMINRRSGIDTGSITIARQIDDTTVSRRSDHALTVLFCGQKLTSDMERYYAFS
ncbi:MAG: hypothetical protein WCQ69_07370 [Bacteroidales bacterium]